MRLTAMKKQSQNKPNSNPIPQKPEMNVSSTLTKDYENPPPRGSKSNQTQSRNSSKSGARSKIAAGSGPNRAHLTYFSLPFGLVSPGQRLLLWHIMNSFCTNTLGCKVNQYQSQQRFADLSTWRMRRLYSAKIGTSTAVLSTRS